MDGESALAVGVELWLNMQILLIDSHRLHERLPPSVGTCQRALIAEAGFESSRMSDQGMCSGQGTENTYLLRTD